MLIPIGIGIAALLLLSQSKKVNSVVPANSPITTNPAKKNTTPKTKPQLLTDKLLIAVPKSLQEYAAKSIPLILKVCEDYGVTQADQIAYIIATAEHESGLGRSMLEYASGSAYEGRKSLGNVNKGDGVKYKGRGFVQITGRNNYTNYSKILGVDLVKNPDLAKDYNIAARILVHGMKTGNFTGKSLKNYFIPGKLQDWYNARRIVNGIAVVNGVDIATLIKTTALKYYAILKKEIK